VRDVLNSRSVSGEVVSTVELLTSEVVTNAIVHAGTDTELVVLVAEERVRVVVRDGSPAAPVPRAGQPQAPPGLGLAIVERLAHRWGVEGVRRGRGKEVWFEVARPRVS
jgi:anti-sigma regulatory factor (Ser/Thr protein kinase)